MASGILVFTGAPLSNSLDWETADLLEDYVAPVARFVGVSRNEDALNENNLTTPASMEVAWRSLALAHRHIPTGHSQVNDLMNEYQGNVSFFNTSEPSLSPDLPIGSQPSGDQSSSSESIEEVLSKYYEHSFAIHANIASSQIPASTSEAFPPSHQAGSHNSYTSSDITASSTSLMPPPVRQPIPAAGHLSDLDDIPNAKYLLSIQPQTMTVNLIVGIIAISAPRGIKTRHGSDVELIEVLVGDETKSGFEITCWLPSSTSHRSGKAACNGLRYELAGLRPQDIILIRNVQLSSFRGKVHGQTLRKDVTKFHLLYRNRIDKVDIGGCYTLAELEDKSENRHPQVAKTSRVKAWVLRFVGGGINRTVIGKAEVVKEVLPPDTQ